MNSTRRVVVRHFHYYKFCTSYWSSVKKLPNVFLLRASITHIHTRARARTHIYIVRRNELRNMVGVGLRMCLNNTFPRGNWYIASLVKTKVILIIPMLISKQALRLVNELEDDQQIQSQYSFRNPREIIQNGCLIVLPLRRVYKLLFMR